MKKVIAKRKTCKTWNTNKTNGWHVYNKLTKNRKFEQIANGNEKGFW